MASPLFCEELFAMFMSSTSFSYVLLRLREDKGFNASAPCQNLQLSSQHFHLMASH